MPLEDTLHGREADAGAFKVLGPVQTLEDPKEFGDVFHVETHAVVTHEKDTFSIFLLESDFNDGLGSRTRKVGQQTS